MRNLFFLLLAFSFINSVYSQEVDAQVSLENTAKQKVKVFAAELKSALVTAIQKDGLHSAVKVCEQRAPEIAKNLSTDGWTVARTSLKTRNESNMPDEWEKQILMRFDEQYKSGEKANTLLISKLNDEEFRFMKAIPTGQVCLACHGTSVDPYLLRKINALYPKDAAVGFTLDDIRGAFSVTKKINDAP
jgi:hypothetical protein